MSLAVIAAVRGVGKGNDFLYKKREAAGSVEYMEEMKNLCERAKVEPDKVFPHNLRHPVCEGIL